MPCHHMATTAVDGLNRVIYFFPDCFIKVTVLFEYLDLALTMPTWISCYNSVALNLILLHRIQVF